MLACRLTRIFATAAAALALAGCPDEGERETHERVAANQVGELWRKAWLDPTDPSTPDRWLASRDAGRDLAPADPAVAAWGQVLDEAKMRFDESGRMIANRAVQLEGMLAEIGVRETAENLVRAFTPLAEKGSRRGFGDLCQHYYNLRVQGEARDGALTALRKAASGEGGR